MRGAVRHAEEHAIYVEAWIKRAYAVLLLDEALPICANRVTVQVVFFTLGREVPNWKANARRPAGAGVFREPSGDNCISISERQPLLSKMSRVEALVLDAVDLRGIANSYRHVKACTPKVIRERDFDFESLR